jgi:hypothetical protein
MDLFVASGMEQSEIVEPVGTAVDLPDDMMHMPSALHGDRLAANRATSRLSQPQAPETATSQVAHEALFAFLEIGFPRWVEGIRISFDLDVPSDSDRRQVLEHYPFARAIALPFLRREYPLGFAQFPVSLGNPAASLVRVATLGPLPQALPNPGLRYREGSTGDRAAMIVGPSTD